MALPSYTRSGQKWKRDWLEIQLDEIEEYDRHNPETASDWLPMMRELYNWCCFLEDRIKELEDNTLP